jgi:plastocyanin
MSDSIRFSAIFRWMLIVVVLIFPQMIQAQWHVTAGAENHDMGHQALAFLPNELWIHVGDSVTWNFNSDEIHTVTFLKTSPSAQVRPPFQVGCPGYSPGPASLNVSTCLTSFPSVTGTSFTVTFPSAGNFKYVCLVHGNMTGVIHVLDLSQPLPHNQEFYDDQAADGRRELLADTDRDMDREGEDSDGSHSPGHHVMAGTGEVSATPGGSQTFSIFRFKHGTMTIHAGDTIEWTNSDPVAPHTITFGTEPGNVVPPSSNVTLDGDGALHAVINSTSDSVNSGLIIAAPQERIGLLQAPLGVTRFRITFTHAGTYPYICALHDQLGMKGTVTVLP